MTRAAALLLVLGTMILTARTGQYGSAPTVALPLGFSLIAAYLAGGVGERARLPRLSGYLLFGLVCGPYALDLITASMARELQAVNGLALALIAFIAGLELNIGRMRPHARDALVLGSFLIVGTFAALTLLLWVAWPWLPFGGVDPGLPRLAAALVRPAPGAPPRALTRRAPRFLTSTGARPIIPSPARPPPIGEVPAWPSAPSAARLDGSNRPTLSTRPWPSRRKEVAMAATVVHDRPVDRGGTHKVPNPFPLTLAGTPSSRKRSTSESRSAAAKPTCSPTSPPAARC
ncbi:MAG: hypothetical protein EHM88_23225, partial [Candidatus Rokuibacteriota bacterium]